MPSACLILANGFEEIEAVSVIDILRRGKINLTVAGLNTPVTSARGLQIIPDTTLAAIATQTFDAIILPGGEPGTSNLEENAQVTQILQTHFALNKLLAAICAAPRILNDLGFLTQVKATSFPKTMPRMTQCAYSEDEVVTDKNIITSRGAGTSLAFAYAVLEYLSSKESVDKLKEDMIYPN